MLEYIFDGGFLMYPITLMSVVGLAVMIDRYCAFRDAKRDTAELRAKVMECLGENRIEDAIEACRECGGPVAAVLLVGLTKFKKLQGTGRTQTEMAENVSKSMDEYAPHAIGVLERNIGALPIVASLSPLLGMTGTVTGMISSFNAMASATNLEASTVSAGISEALITTAGGLLVAMPSVIAYNIFSKMVDNHVTDIESSATELSDFIMLDYVPPQD